ncbi:MAG: hypothetical protein J1E34_08150 [Oscillospiraceae bacterium]|nr:hypothetical protein [Oscillospiraceae bacterium]
MEKSEFNSYFYENGLRKGAKYDSIFFGAYAGTGSTFDIRVRFEFKKKLNLHKLQEAADEAIKFYQEFAVRPVIHKGRVCYEKNNSPVKIAADDGKSYYFGTDGENGTNGYLFIFLCGERELTFSLFHGLTDAHGMILFVISVICEYFNRTFPPLKGLSSKLLTRMGIRLGGDLQGLMDDVERYDPLKKFAEDNKPVELINTDKLFILPPEEYSKEDISCRLINLEISNKSFYEKTKELGTSFAPLLCAIAANAINSAYNIGDKVISVITTVNPRKFIKTDSLANMAYNCPLPVTKDDLSLPPEKLCAKIRADMKMQTTEKNARATFNSILSQCAQIDKMGDIVSANEILTGENGVKTLTTNGTVFLTYPGRITNNIISRMLLRGISPEMLAVERAIVAYAHGDSFIIQITQKSDDMTLVNALRRSLENYGFKPKTRDLGRITQNIMELKRLKTVL